MDNPEHIFAIRLFLAATAIAVAGVGVNQADWKHPLFVKGLFGSAAVLFIAAIAWPTIAPKVPDGIGLPLSAIASSLISWLLLLAITVVAICALDYRERSKWRTEFPRIVDLLSGVAIVAAAPIPEPPKPKEPEWFSPLRAVDKFVDQGVLQAALTALSAVRAAREEQQQQKKPEGEDPFIFVTNQAAGKKVRDAEWSYTAARNKVFNELIEQLKQGTLVGRALPFDAKVLDGDWETIKQPYWSVLAFDMYNDPKMETVSGGGRTYKGLQIARAP
jgi:hypothetical protein